MDSTEEHYSLEYLIFWIALQYGNCILTIDQTLVHRKTDAR